MGQTATLVYRGPSGRVVDEILYRHDEPRIELVEAGRPWGFGASTRTGRCELDRRHCSTYGFPGRNAKVYFDPTIPGQRILILLGMSPSFESGRMPLLP
jgi:hypothetical protein